MNFTEKDFTNQYNKLRIFKEIKLYFENTSTIS